MIPEWNSFINADCMEYLKEFPDNYFDLAIVDPPYGGVTQGGYATNQMGGGIARNRNDYHLGVWAYDRPSADYFNELLRVSKNQIIWGGNYYASLLPDSQGWIVWDKEKPEGISFADCELAWTSFNVATRIFKFAWNGMLQGDMKNKEYKIHPTQKPVRLYEWLLSRYANENDTILDTHVGSGSSLIACHNSNHKYIGFEIDPVYYEKAKERIDQENAQINIFDILT
jgi:site-specific DNA-methyltransferase (adenine-specific)